MSSEVPPSSAVPGTDPAPRTPPPAPRRVAVTGAGGLIGGALAGALRAEGREVVRLVRREPREADEAYWDPSGREHERNVAALAGCDAVVHMAGAGVADRRWTAAYKRELRDSRVLGTAAVAAAIAAQETPPRVFVCGSAIGYYGDTGDRAVDEDAPPGSDFLARLCQEWEAAAAPAAEAGVRTVFARTGLVVAASGGAWGPLFRIFRAGIGGRIGSGRQYWSAISLDDHLAALTFLLDMDARPDGAEPLSGPVNLTGPEPATNREVTRVMGRALRRPTVFAVPGFVLRVVLGEFAGDVLGSQRVLPTRLLNAGFTFAHPTVTDAVQAALAGGRP
ncbi:TIGR01777 family oxidoreductase [Streptomyces sp. DSM 44917]|uniref:TIGR01777 family oxidoreductase n=1 Tax=Streptomyces boetiae TaxID=3075541 RepID=A0ABU2L7M5_9ACTN|nr:TIGR01777 family oxidoreductase [Streptomyces sp. DSM 44917]MDT0307585.1 TIGR01777 family oxidoreductase [Streptomyces sp. DSM 44917]